MIRFVCVLLVALWFAAGAPADPLVPDPPPPAHHAAHVVWTYVFVWHTRDGRTVRCVVPPRGKRRCRVIH